MNFIIFILYTIKIVFNESNSISICYYWLDIQTRSWILLLPYPFLFLVSSLPSAHSSLCLDVSWERVERTIEKMESSSLPKQLDLWSLVSEISIAVIPKDSFESGAESISYHWENWWFLLIFSLPFFFCKNASVASYLSHFKDSL